MRYAYQPAFLETARHLSSVQGSKLLKAIEKFQDAMETRQWPHGLGITHLRDNYFEFRVDIHTRVIYHRESDVIHYILYGSHDQIRRFVSHLS